MSFMVLWPFAKVLCTKFWGVGILWQDKSKLPPSVAKHLAESHTLLMFSTLLDRNSHQRIHTYHTGDVAPKASLLQTHDLG